MLPPGCTIPSHAYFRWPPRRIFTSKSRYQPVNPQISNRPPNPPPTSSFVSAPALDHSITGVTRSVTSQPSTGWSAELVPSEITGVYGRLKGRWKAAATSTWDNVKDDKGGKGGEDVSPAYGVRPCGSSCRNAFTEVIPVTVERNTRDSLRRAKLEDRSATSLTDRTTLKRLGL